MGDINLINVNRLTDNQILETGHLLEERRTDKCVYRLRKLILARNVVVLTDYTSEDVVR